MEMGEEPRHRKAAANEETRKAVGATRISLFALLVAVLIGVVVFGWLWAR
jgi:small-conductance mechanosensitive channel